MLESRLRLCGIAYPPVFSATRCYLSYRDGSIEAFELASGNRLWQRTLGEPFNPLAPGGDQGHLLLCGDLLLTAYNETLFALNLDTGEVRNQVHIDGFTLHGATTDGEMFYALRFNDELECTGMGWNPLSSSPLWQISFNGMPDSITLASNLLLLTPDDEEFVAIEIHDGSIRWQCSLASLALHTVSDDSAPLIAGPPVTSDTIAVFGIIPYCAVAFDLVRGELLWVRPLSVRNPAALRLVSGETVLTLDGGSICRFDLATGAEYNTTDIEPALSQVGLRMPGPPTLDDGHAFVADVLRGTVAAIELATNCVTWNASCETAVPHIFPPQFHAGRLYLVDEAGTLHIFRPDIGFAGS